MPPLLADFTQPRDLQTNLRKILDTTNGTVPNLMDKLRAMPTERPGAMKAEDDLDEFYV